MIEGIDRVGDTHLEYVLQLPDAADTSGFVPLPPASGRVPMLHLKHGLEHNVPILRMTATLIDWHIDEPVATAWRFESPEGSGEHNYWHCQPVRELRGGKQIEALKKLPEWYFVDSPTLPLLAKDADGLLISMLVSIYGLTELRAMQSETFGDKLSEHLSGIAAL
jgi:hypothetical protein